MPGRLVSFLFFLSLVTCVGAAGPAPNAPSRAESLLTASLRFGDRLYDDRVALLWSPAVEDNSPGERRHRVRESVWYALGLMQRNGVGDRERAVRIIEAVLAQQIKAPGEPYHGTFYRFPEEPPPPVGARPWIEYDPNWRQFIGTAFALLITEYGPALPPALTPRLLESIRLAVDGELAQHRLHPSYTNIALMHGFLWAYAGHQLHREDWIRESADWCDSVHRLFAVHQTFEEYNSPTYYGVDLYGLALWRKYGPTPQLRQLGAEMEAALWRDIADFYQPELRNLCGPFDRAYGMDMRHYVALTGIWLGLVLPADRAPLPDPSGPMDHAHDFLYTPLFVLLEPRIPADAMAKFTAFAGEHTVTRVITPERTATAWLTDGLMLGGEITTMTKAAGTSGNQFHPATMHWRAPGQEVGWMALRVAPRVDARATANTLTITAIGTATFRLSVKGGTAAGVAKNRWTLPGLRVDVDTDATSAVVNAGPDTIDITYREATHYVLHPTLVP